MKILPNRVNPEARSQWMRATEELKCQHRALKQQPSANIPMLGRNGSWRAKNIKLYSAVQFESQRCVAPTETTSSRKKSPLHHNTLLLPYPNPLCKHTHAHTHTSCLTIQALPCGPLKYWAPLSKCKPYKDTEEQKPPRRATFCPAFASPEIPLANIIKKKGGSKRE